MANSKVVLGDEVLIDLTFDTVESAADIAEGKYGHLKDGTRVLGTLRSFSGGAYNVVSVDNGDGTQDLRITDAQDAPSASAMNVQGYHGLAEVASSSLKASGVRLTVEKTGTYKVSWMGARNNTSNTWQTQLYIDGRAYGSAQTSFTRSYAQSVVLTGVQLTAGQTVEVYARSRSTSYYMMVGNLIIEQTA